MRSTRASSNDSGSQRSGLAVRGSTVAAAVAGILAFLAATEMLHAVPTAGPGSERREATRALTAQLGSDPISRSSPRPAIRATARSPTCTPPFRTRPWRWAAFPRRFAGDAAATCLSRRRIARGNGRLSDAPLVRTAPSAHRLRRGCRRCDAKRATADCSRSIRSSCSCSAPSCCSARPSGARRRPCSGSAGSHRASDAHGPPRFRYRGGYPKARQAAWRHALEGRLWGYHFDTASAANYTLQVPLAQDSAHALAGTRPSWAKAWRASASS